VKGGYGGRYRGKNVWGNMESEMKNDWFWEGVKAIYSGRNILRESKARREWWW